MGAVVNCKYKPGQPFVYGDSLIDFAPSKPKAKAKASEPNTLLKLQAELLAQVSNRR